MSGLEIPGFIIGAAGLLGLFSTCIQGLDIIETASNIGKDSQISVTKFENAKYLLKEWGRAVGLETSDGAIDPNHHPDLDSPEVLNQVGFLLGTITLMFLDSDKLSRKYGLKVPLGAHTTNGILSLKDLIAAITTRAASVREGTSLWGRTRWAISNKKQFGSLADEISVFVDKLYSIINPFEYLVTCDLDEIKSSINNMQHVAAEARRDMEARLAELRLFIEDDAKQRTSVILGSLRCQLAMDAYLQRENRERLLAWIGAVSTESEYAEALRLRHEGTCTWITRNKCFLEWQEQGQPAALWLYGGAGIGKTFLSASIIEFLERSSASPVAYFFCRNDDSRKSNTNSILSSWIYQLASQRVEALKVVERLKEGEPTNERLWRIFSQILDSIGCCNLVIDGLDECLDYDATARYQELGAIERFLSSIQLYTSTRAKILVISRDQPVIRSGLQNAASYAISKEDTANDIESYATSILDNFGIKESKSREDSLHRICTGCDGMFLLVRLQGRRLTPRMTPREIERTFSSMPQNLDEAYKRDLLSISGLSKETQVLVKDIFRWVLFALRPLSVRELLHLLAINDSDQVFPEDNIPDPIDDECIRYRILEKCRSFITVAYGETCIAGNRIVQFSHFSAKEYLLSTENHSIVESKQPDLAGFFYPIPDTHHSILARSCLLYLLLALQLDDMGYKTIRYPVIGWMKHLQKVPEDCDHAIDLQKKLFTRGESFDKWRNCTKLGGDYTPDWETPLKCACWYGLVHLCNTLLSDLPAGVLDPSELNQALLLAVYNGHLRTINTLLKRKESDVNATDEYGRRPLLYAVSRRHKEVVKLLLAVDRVDVNAVGWGGWTPLILAAYCGYEDMVELLLEVDQVDVNTKNNMDCTPIFIAVIQGREDIVKLLLAVDGVDVNAANKQGITPLQSATRHGHKGIVNLLLLAEVNGKAKTVSNDKLGDPLAGGQDKNASASIISHMDDEILESHPLTQTSQQMVSNPKGTEGEVSVPANPGDMSFGVENTENTRGPVKEAVSALLGTDTDTENTDYTIGGALPIPSTTEGAILGVDGTDEDSLEVVPLLLVSERLDVVDASRSGWLSLHWVAIFLFPFLFYLLC